ncbi:hypothetical protein J6590_085029 [Homalodisca vitripennis]|nr:hypothetical protein J6590_085029 [Homalodisca vitripennis]
MLADQNTKLEGYLKVMESLTQENVQLKKKFAALENRVEEMERYSRSNCLEIHGIPEEKTEDVVSVVKEVGKALDMPITDYIGNNKQQAQSCSNFFSRLERKSAKRRANSMTQPETDNTAALIDHIIVRNSLSNMTVGVVDTSKILDGRGKRITDHKLVFCDCTCKTKERIRKK